MADMKVPPVEFVTAAKQLGLSDADAASMYNRAIQSNPGLADVPGTELAKVVVAAKGSGRTSDIPTQLSDPYAGSGYTQADAMKPFDPKTAGAAELEARSKYKELYEQTAGRRGIANMLGSFGTSEGMTNNRANWDALDKYNEYMARSGTAALGASQKAATEGQAQATSLQKMGKEAGEFTGSQMGKREEVRQSQLKTNQMEAMQDPENATARVYIAYIRYARDNGGPQVSDADLKKMTPEQLEKLIDPKMLDQAKKAADVISANIANTTEEAYKNTAVPGAGPTPGMPGSPSSATPQAPSAAKQTGYTSSSKDTYVVSADQIAKDREALGMMKSEFDKTTDKGERAALLRDMARLESQIKKNEAALPKSSQKLELGTDAKDRLQFSPMTVGKQTLQVDPRVTAGAASEGEQAAKAEERFRAYDVEIAPALGAVREKLRSVSSGKGTETIARLLPGNETQDLVNKINRANTLYPGMLQGVMGPEMSKSISQGGFTGALVSSMTVKQVNDMLDLIEKGANSDRAYQQKINAGQRAGIRPGQSGANMSVPTSRQSTPSTSVVPMMKNGVLHNIPADKVEKAISLGYTRK